MGTISWVVLLLAIIVILLLWLLQKQSDLLQYARSTEKRAAHTEKLTEEILKVARARQGKVGFRQDEGATPELPRARGERRQTARGGAQSNARRSRMMGGEYGLGDDDDD